MLADKPYPFETLCLTGRNILVSELYIRG